MKPQYSPWISKVEVGEGEDMRGLGGLGGDSFCAETENCNWWGWNGEW